MKNLLLTMKELKKIIFQLCLFSHCCIIEQRPQRVKMYQFYNVCFQKDSIFRNIKDTTNFDVNNIIKSPIDISDAVIVFFIPFVIMAIFLGLFITVKQNITSHTTMEFAYLGYFIGALVGARMVSKRWIKYGATGKKGTKALKFKKYQQSAGVFEKAPELINLILFPILSATTEWRFGKDRKF